MHLLAFIFDHTAVVPFKSRKTAKLFLFYVWVNNFLTGPSKISEYGNKYHVLLVF